MPTLQPGVHIAKHVIVRCLGAGKFAETYEVIDPTGARRALKLLNAEASPASKPAARLGQEAEAIAMCEHVNVVRFYDVGVAHGRPWLLMELVEGRDLRQVLEDSGGRLPLARAVSLVRHAAEGAAAVHQLKIVHRDLKPENILVTADDVAKVADFGWARMPKWGVRTSTEEEIGSALYTAPEYMRDRVVSPKMDVYSLAIVLYELIAGVNPIVQGPASMFTICAQHLSYEPPPLDSLGLDVPGDISDLVARALAKDPAKRPSMRKFANGLASALSRLNVQRRAAARSVPLPNREPGLALTEPAMAAWGPEWGPSGSAPPMVPPASSSVSTSSAPRSVRGGTLQMPASAGPAAAVPRDMARDVPVGSRHDTERDAFAPPAPSVLPPTLRTPSQPSPPRARGGTEVMQVAPVAQPPPQALVPAFMQTARSTDVAPATPAERGSTGVPVEAAVPRPSMAPRALPLVAIGAVLVAVGLTAGWLIFGQGGKGRPAPASPPATPTTSASSAPPKAAPSTTASAKSAKRSGAPKPNTTVPKSRARYPGAPTASSLPRPKLPF